MDEDGFFGAKFAQDFKGLVGGDKDFHDPGRLDVGQVIGFGKDHISRNSDVLGVSAL